MHFFSEKTRFSRTAYDNKKCIKVITKSLPSNGFFFHIKVKLSSHFFTVVWRHVIILLIITWRHITVKEVHHKLFEILDFK